MSIQELYQIYQKHPVITTDSRNCPPGSIFFALKGDRFDGNEYIEQALKFGCAYAVGDGTSLPSNDRIIRVEDSLITLQQLANYHRKQLQTPIIAITGTNGKTTTKELVAATLSKQYKTLFTQGNLNNHIGVPLTLLQLRPGHELAVIEMGANHPGEIRELCLIAEPNYGIITNVGKAHLEGFGSFEGVIQTKGELYEFIRQTNGTLFVNHENAILKNLAQGINIVYYGQTPESTIWGEESGPNSLLSLRWHKAESTYSITTQLTGAYNLENILAAITIASFFKVDDQDINQAIQDYIPQNNRSQQKETGKNHLIIDAYNANPTSMAAALSNFTSLSAFPKAVILGEMNELGKYTQEEHQKIIEMLAGSSIDRIILCGESFLACNPQQPEWLLFSKTADLLAYLQTEQISGYHILIKGSRGNQLEKTIEFL